MTGTPSNGTADEQTQASPRRCTNCGKSVEDLPYQLWLFHTCRSCALDADGRFRDCGTARKWKYRPLWHMSSENGGALA